MVDEPRQYSAAEMERMMRVQDVLLKAMAKKITWWAAAEILGVTDRTMRRWREKLQKDGYAGLADRRKGKPSAQRTGRECHNARWRKCLAATASRFGESMKSMVSPEESTARYK